LQPTTAPHPPAPVLRRLLQAWRRGEAAAEPPGWAWPQKLHLLLFVLSAVCSTTSAAFWWLAIYKPSAGLRLDGPMEHGASAGLLLADLLLSRTPILSYHFQVPMASTGAYAAFMWVWYGATKEWLYSSLQWDDSGDTANYCALLAIVILSFLVLYMVAGLRELLVTGKCCCCAGCACCGSACRPDEEEGAEGEQWGAAPGDVAPKSAAGEEEAMRRG
jgi:hypothetical protein